MTTRRIGAGVILFRSCIVTPTMRSFSVQTMTVNQYSKILKSADQRNNFQIVDVREPDELKAVNVNDEKILNLPISLSWKWGGDIARHKTLDPVKPVICVVSALKIPLICGLQFSSVDRVEGV